MQNEADYRLIVSVDDRGSRLSLFEWCRGRDFCLPADRNRVSVGDSLKSSAGWVGTRDRTSFSVAVHSIVWTVLTIDCRY